MTEPRPRRGSLYLVPVALGEHTPWAHFLPAQAQAIAAGLRHFVVETARAARAHLKQLDYPHPLRETDIRELPAEAADAVLDTLLAHPPTLLLLGTELATQDAHYLRAEFTSQLMRFVDDVEFLIGQDAVEVRSASRLGHSDLGVNRERIEGLRQQLSQP